MTTIEKKIEKFGKNQRIVLKELKVNGKINTRQMELIFGNSKIGLSFIKKLEKKEIVELFDYGCFKLTKQGEAYIKTITID